MSLENLQKFVKSWTLFEQLFGKLFDYGMICTIKNVVILRHVFRWLYKTKRIFHIQGKTEYCAILKKEKF